jgi:hypothetical protein
LPLSFHRKSIDSLPPLAWLFTITKSGEATLVHGAGVEVFSNGFFEGCLASDGGEDFTKIAEVFGSGMKVQDGRYAFITPAHTLESLFLYQHENGLSLSNSLSFLLEYHGVVLPWDIRYGTKFASLVRGIDAYERELLRTAEGEVSRVVYDNVIVEPEGRHKLLRKPLPPAFETYSEYVTYLGETLQQALADAKRGGRVMRYQPLATCSTGYDSAAVAALARTWGCRQAITLTHARGGAMDSGKAVAEMLGLEAREFAYAECAETSFQEIAEFLATGMGGEDYCFQPFAPALRGRVLLTGHWGGDVWETYVPRIGAAYWSPNEVFHGPSLCGMSLQEFRLSHDFIHIPVPVIGARRHTDVWRISNAPEMEPYRLHNDYDRPIPRRILEESGIPRAMFGQRKKAASILLFSNPHLLSGKARAEFETLAGKIRVPRITYWSRSLDWQLRYQAWQMLLKVASNSLVKPLMAERLWPYSEAKKTKNVDRGTLDRIYKTASNLIEQLLVGDWRVFEHSRPEAALEFCAAVSLIRGRYRVAKEGCN